jgi:hypothetical protein
LRIQRAWSHGRYAGLILLGPRTETEHVRKELPDQLAAQVACELPESWYERAAEITASVVAAATQVFAADEAKAVHGLWDRLADNKSVATGARDVLAALQNGRIGPAGHGYLAMGPDPRETVGRCTRCRSLAFDAPKACPRCQAPCAAGNLWEEMLLMALRHDVNVHEVHDVARLAPYGGIVAALREGTNQ